VLLQELRDAARGQRVDPGLAGRLRRRVEEFAERAGFDPQGEPVEVHKADLAAAGSCVGLMLSTRWMPPEEDRRELVLGRLADALASRALVVGALDVPSPSGLLAMVELGADEADRLGVTDDVLTSAARLAIERLREAFDPLAGRGLPPGFLCRTEQTMRVRLFDGALVFGGRADVVLGGGGDPESTTAIVELKAGQVHPEEHLAEAAFYALAETLRSGVAPRAIAVVYLGTEGSPYHKAVDEELLVEVAEQVGTVARALQLAQSSDVIPLDPSPRSCGRCRARQRCSAATPAWAGQ